MSPAEIGWNNAIPHPKCCIFFAYLMPRLSARDAMVMATNIDGRESFVCAPCWEVRESGGSYGTHAELYLGWVTLAAEAEQRSCWSISRQLEQ